MIDRFPLILKWKILILKPVLLALRGRRPMLTKLPFNFIIFILILMEIVYNTLLNMIFQYDWESVLIQLILIEDIQKWQLHNDLGRLFVYLGKREYVQCDGVIEPVQGVVFIQVNKSGREGTLHCKLHWYSKL